MPSARVVDDAVVTEEDGVIRGVFCEADEKSLTQFTYVGEAQGSYNADVVYDYVGKEKGSFDKSKEVNYFSLRPNATFMATLGIVIVVGGAIFGLASGLKGISQGSPCALHDCLCGLREGWVGDSQLRCCRNNGIGCPEDGSAMPLDGIGKLSSPLQGCATQCLLGGISASCAARVAFAARHDVQGRMGVDECRAAYSLVRGQCSFCSTCALREVGCDQYRQAQDSELVAQIEGLLQQ